MADVVVDEFTGSGNLTAHAPEVDPDGYFSAWLSTNGNAAVSGGQMTMLGDDQVRMRLEGGSTLLAIDGGVSVTFDMSLDISKSVFASFTVRLNNGDDDLAVRVDLATSGI